MSLFLNFKKLIIFNFYFLRIFFNIIWAKRGYMIRRVLLYKTLIFFITFQFAITGILISDEWDNQRIWLGLEMFPTILSADKNITEKIDNNGKLLLVLLYENKQNIADDMIKSLRKIGKIRNIPIEIEATNDFTLKKYETRNIAGIFLIERINHKQFKDVSRYGKKHSIIVFSPFEKDVEMGIPAGIIIYDRIFPYINQNAIKAYNVKLKDLFLEIAEQYD